MRGLTNAPVAEVLKLTPLGQYGPIRLEPDREAPALADVTSE